VYRRTLETIREWNKVYTPEEWQAVRPKLTKLLDYALMKYSKQPAPSEVWNKVGELEEEKLDAIKLKRRLWEW
jgi:hypothetical protein